MSRDTIVSGSILFREYRWFFVLTPVNCNSLKLLVDFLIISIVNRVQLTLDIKYILWIIIELNLKN